MNLPRVPPFLVGGAAALPDLFLALGRARCIPREDVEKIIELLPGPIRNSPCFLDRLTGIWRYDFGEPFAGLLGSGMALGTHMFQEVERLFDVLSCACRRLPPEQLSSYLSRLADTVKHEDMLVEFVPILRLSTSVEAIYEVIGYAEGNKTIDWMIRAEDGAQLLIDVKNRTRDLLESLERIQAGERDPDDSAPAPIHDPSILFRSLETKFKSRPAGKIIQAAWINTSLQQEESELAEAFARVDRTRVHLAILGDWEDDVYILVDDNSVKERVVRLLQVRESRRFVFRRSEG